MTKEFEGYKIRTIRLSEEEWRNLKSAKLKSGLTWNNFIKQLTKDK
jgi:predicted DNA binding CopG/RHH family protein